MPDDTIEARLSAITLHLDQATEALARVHSDLQIESRIESANTREIEKLKRHVAKLQHAEPTDPLAHAVDAPTAN